MRINQRGGHVDEFGRYTIASNPYRFDSNRGTRVLPDGSYEDLSFDRGVTLDRWLVYLNYLGASGGEGYVEQVRCINASEWTPTTTVYTEGTLVRPPAGQYGAGYVYRCLQNHTPSASWNTDVKTPLDPTSWQAIPRYWGIYGIYETDPNLQNKFALHWKQTVGSSAQVWLEQRILGLDWIKPGTYTLSFVAKDRNGGGVPVRVQVIQEAGVGQTDHTFTSATQNLSASGQRHEFLVTLKDPRLSQGAGYASNNRQESVQVAIYFPTAGQTFDVLITDVQFEEGACTDFEHVPFDEELARCQAYYWKTNPLYLPARWASYVADYNSTGGAAFAVIEADQLWDRYGQIINDAASGNGTINWGGTNRAYLNNEREEAGRGKLRVIAERQSKAYPPFDAIGFPVPMVREPQVTVWDLIGAQEGYATAYYRFAASLQFSHTGAGASARPFAQRSLVKVATFGVTRNRADLAPQNFDPTTAFEELSSTVTLAAGVDAIPTAFLTLFAGYKYAWDWSISTAGGTNVFYLHLANVDYVKLGSGAAIALPNWASGVAQSVGDVVRVPATLRYYECVVGLTAAQNTVAPADSDVNWRPYGRITFPFEIKLDGTKLTRSNIANPASLAGNQWAFGDVDGLGFSTLYVRMNGGLADPGSAAGRVTAQSYDQIVDTLEQLMAQAEFDAEIYSL